MTSRFICRSVLGPALALSTLLAMAVLPNAAWAQGQPSVQSVSLAVQQSANGSQSVITPRGYLVPLPGPGVNSSVVSIYMGNNGGFWYTDRHGQNVDITSYVQEIRAKYGQMQQATPPQYAPVAVQPQYVAAGMPPQEYAAPPQYSTSAAPPQYAQQQQQTSSSSAGTGLAAAAGAMAGSMAGAAMANTGYYHNVPYGTPMYYGNNGRPAYNDDRGHQVFVNDDGDVKWNNVYAANNIQKANQEQKISQAQAYNQHQNAQQTQNMEQMQQQRAAAGSQSSQRGMSQQFSDQQKQQFQQQQSWYQNQSKDKTRAEGWQKNSQGDNPFVRQGSGGDRAGRDGGGDGGGFGDRAAARGGGGGFADRRAAGGGGRARGGGRRGR